MSDKEIAKELTLVVLEHSKSQLSNDKLTRVVCDIYKQIYEAVASCNESLKS